MNKTELIDAIAAKTSLPKTVATKALGGVIEAIEEALEGGDEVTLVGFGTFYVAKRAARNGRNPQTGATIKIPATQAPRFRAGKGFKERVCEKKSHKKK